MTPVKSLALFVAVLAGVKLVVIFIKPESWIGVVKKAYAKPIYTIPIALTLALVILSYLLEEMTIVQIFAVMSFLMAIMMVGVASYGSEIIEFSEKLLKDRNAIKKAWLSIAVWILLIVWVLYEIFA